MIYIILPVHNREKITIDFANFLANQLYKNFYLILVDDGCTDNTVPALRNIIKKDQLHIISGNGALWWAGSLQVAYNFLMERGCNESDIVLIINDDVIFDEQFLLNGLLALKKYPGCAIQAQAVDQFSEAIDYGTYFNQKNFQFYSSCKDKEINCLSTRGLIMPAQVFLRSGGFKPKLLPHYFSDYEFTIRLHRKGIPLRCDKLFSLTAKFDETGLQSYDIKNGIFNFIKNSFSNRAKYNPLRTSLFAVSVCSFPYSLIHIIRIWVGFFVAMNRAIFIKNES